MFSAATIRVVRISTKLMLGLTTVIVGILGAYGMWEQRREERDLRASARHELKLLATAIQEAIENSVRDRQPADIREILDSLEVGDSSLDVLVFDADGHLIASSPGAEQSWGLVRGAVREVASTRRALMRFEGPHGLSHLCAVLPLRGDGGTDLGAVAVVRPLVELQRDLRATSLVIVTSSVILIGAVSGASWLVVMLLVRRPLAGLVVAMRAARSGDLSTRVVPRRADEVGELAVEFNALMSDLAAAQRRLIESTDAHEAIQVALRRADKLVTLGQLSAGLAHEIGSPLQILNGRARALVRRQDLPADVIRTAEILEVQSDRIARIVERLLSFARRKAAHMTAVDVGKAVRTIVDLLEPEARRRGLRLELDCQDALPAIVADGDQVQQLALNLLTNAIRATPRGGQVRVAVSMSAVAVAGCADTVASVRIVVEDTGPGISTPMLDRIFEPFFTTSGDTGGTGLGLAVVKSIVEEHRGAVSVRSEPGSGTRFTVHIPVAERSRMQEVIA